MAITITKPAAQIERRTYFSQIATPHNGIPTVEILREEIEGDRVTKLGIVKKLTYPQLMAKPQFADFLTAIGCPNGMVFFTALRDLYDNVCEEETPPQNPA